MLTHAHLDHCGYLPRLVAQGFRGRVFCTAGTQDLCRIVLPDAGRIQEEDAANANRHGYSKHAPALPLYTETDAFRAVSQLQPVGYDARCRSCRASRWSSSTPGICSGPRTPASAPAAQRSCSAAISAASAVRCCPIPRWSREADYLLVESTYGNRVHDHDDNGAQLADVITRTTSRGGRVIIPSFAIGRVEELLYWLKRLEEEQRIPVLPVFVDSPMAIEALSRYQQRLHGARSGPAARSA